MNVALVLAAIDLVSVLAPAGAVATLIGAIVMLGPNRASLAVKTANDGILIAVGRAEQAERSEAAMRTELDEAEVAAGKLRTQVRTMGGEPCA